MDGAAAMMPGPRRTGIAAVAAALLAWLAVPLSAQAPTTPTAAKATELRIRVRPPGGETEPVRVLDAQLLLAWWGYTEEVPLEHRYDSGDLVVTVPLEGEVWASGGGEPEFAYVYLEFDGFVPVRSEKFYWLQRTPRARGRAGSETVKPVEFWFRGGPTVHIRGGETREVQLQARRAVPKQVRFIDDRGQPVSDISVDAGMYWSRSNHCGHPADMRPLFEGRPPDAAGVLPVPDGDIEYGFWINGAPHIAVAGAEDFMPHFLNTFVDGPESVLRIRRHERVPLTMRVSIDGVPAADVTVGATGIAGCMNTTFDLGRTDERGMLDVPDFYPEEYEGICIGSADRDRAWVMAPPRGGEITVDLPAGTKVGEVVYCGRN